MQVINSSLSDDILRDVPDEDRILVENILQGLESLGSDEFPACKKYKITNISTGYLIHAKLPSTDPFEINIEDLLFLQSIHPARIENIAIGRATHGTHNIELFIRILDFRQRIMIKSSLALYRQASRLPQESASTQSHPQGTAVTSSSSSSNTSTTTTILMRKRKMQEMS